MAELPAGTVTFLFTDLEGSTRLWDEHPDAMKVALARHDEILRDAVDRHGGAVVKTTGDGLHAVFTIATSAVASAVDAQRALIEEAWPLPQPLLVRMGVHTGHAELRDGDYYGTAVNRAARIASVAHGGQIVCSLATEELVRDEITTDVALVDLGEHALRDLARAEHLIQVNHPDLRHDFPALRSLDLIPNNLPRQLASFVGRRREVRDIAEALTEAPLVTLTGVGGVGKTRLALQVAAEVMPHFADGAWLVDLAATRDPGAIVAVVATAINTPLRAGPSRGDTLLDILRQREILLVLDNCEHLIGAVADLAYDVLQRCPRVRMLATSREGLGIAGERIVPIGSLPVAENDGDGPAIHLFVDRAGTARPGFVLTDDTREAVAQICRRLDGIPLAIELAATRVKALAPAAIAERLDQRFQLLAGGRRGAVERHQTLQAAIDWSYDLLDQGEQQCLLRLSVFAGDFDLQAAEAVVADGDVERSEVLFVLEALVDKSLLDVDDVGDTVRYRLLETVRQYATVRLDELGDVAATRDRHLAYYTEFAEACAVEFVRPGGTDAIERRDREVENLRSALMWAIDRDDVDHAIRMVCAVGIAEWLVVNPLNNELLAVVDMPGVDAHPRYAEYLARAGNTKLRSADIEPGVRLCKRALEVAREQSIDSWVIRNVLTVAKWFEGDVDGALVEADRALALAPDLATESILLSTKTGVLVYKGDRPAARATIARGLQAAQESRNPYVLANAYVLMGNAYWADDPDAAFDAYYEIWRLVGHLEQSDSALFAASFLAEISSRRSDRAAFAFYAAAAVTHATRRAEWYFLCGVLCNLTLAFARFGDLVAAAEALGGAEQFVVLQTEQGLLDARAMLAPYANDPQIVAARAAGASRAPEDNAARAIQVIERIAAEGSDDS